MDSIMLRLLSTDAINKDFELPEYRRWVKRLSLEDAAHHAKFWEQMMIYEALKEHGVLAKGKKGIGFGVGTEPLVSVFANEGAQVLATDQAPEDEALAWDNGQLAKGKSSLYDKKLIDKKKFDKNVSFEHHDMNIFNKKWADKFDFAWSNCVIGHLGSMKLSEKHLVRHSKYIKYGGISVLTTELNISSLTETVDDNSGTIIWRLSDLRRLFSKMLDEDMVASRFKLRLKADDTDDYIYYEIGSNTPDGIYLPDAYITKIPFSNYAIVQIQIIFKKKRLTAAQRSIYRALYALDFARNTQKLRQYINSGGDITDYNTKYESTNISVTPVKKTQKITAKKGELSQVSLTFENKSTQPLFAYGLHTPLHVPPTVLATAGPVNRNSKLHSKTWFSENRPTVTFEPHYDKRDYVNHSHGEHRVLPGEKFTYTFGLQAPKKAGTYKEELCLVLEGMGDIPSSRVTLDISVK